MLLTMPRMSIITIYLKVINIFDILETIITMSMKANNPTHKFKLQNMAEPDMIIRCEFGNIWEN